MSQPLRVGVVPYLNVAPIVRGLASDPRFDLQRDLPSRVAERLHASELDLGMIPSIEYARGAYAIVPGVAIGSRGPVRSVRLLHRVPLAEVRRVALDASSRTSAALLRIVLRQRLGRDPEYLTLPPDAPAMLAVADAALLIGDPALYWEGEAESLDLGEEWTRTSGLPFVYAFWAGRPGALRRDDVARLQASLAAGLRALPEIAASYDGHAALNQTYLCQHMAYGLGEAEREGLREFYRRASALGVIPAEPELRFYDGP